MMKKYVVIFIVLLFIFVYFVVYLKNASQEKMLQNIQSSFDLKDNTFSDLRQEFEYKDEFAQLIKYNLLAVYLSLSYKDRYSKPLDVKKIYLNQLKKLSTVITKEEFDKLKLATNDKSFETFFKILYENSKFDESYYLDSILKIEEAKLVLISNINENYPNNKHKEIFASILQDSNKILNLIKQKEE